MKKIVFLILILTSCQLSYGQSDLRFKGANIPGNTLDTGLSTNFNEYVSRSFYGLYRKYFLNACGHYYDVFTITFDLNGKPRNITFSGPPSILTDFINEAVAKTEGKWEFLDKCNGPKILIVPVFFKFTVSCDRDNPRIIKPVYYASPAGLTNTPKTINGLTLQSVSNNTFTLWPIELQGPFLDSFIKPQ
jgi:hypothetical protein